MKPNTAGRYTPDVDVVPEGEKVLCAVCSDEMNESRNCVGPRGFAQAMSGGKSLHDVFECPNIDEKWHQKIIQLWREAEKTPSSTLQDIYLKEAQEILESRQNKGVKMGEPEEFEQDDLQLFAHKVGIIVALESNKGNEISMEDAYDEIKSLWKKLKKKKKKAES